MELLSIDFETRSGVDLKACGAYRYATDPSTGIYCLSWAFGDEEPATWLPGQPFPERIVQHIKDGGKLAAWNAQFERLIWWYVLGPDYGVPDPDLEQFICTAAQARTHGMPGKLDDCARAMEIRLPKDTEGARLVREYSARNVPWEQIPEEDRALWVRYCEQDVRVERGLRAYFRPLTDHEWYEFHVTERINDRGVPLDLEFVREAAQYGAELRDSADEGVRAVTGGAVPTARARKTRDAWLLPQLTPDQLRILLKVRTRKLPDGTTREDRSYSFEETRRNYLLAEPDLPAPVRSYLELVAEAGGATLGKYQAMLDREIDGRINGALMFNGAGQTGRFSSRGLQLHNLSRAGDLEDPDRLVDIITRGYYLPGTVTDTTTQAKILRQLVRSAVYQESGLSWCDWSNVEGRVAPWLSDSAAGERKLDVFREGRDPYIENAMQTFRVSADQVTKDQRQAGKLQELALQFLGGVGALKMMGVNYGVKVTDEQATEWRDAWRALNPWAQSFGKQLEIAAMNACRRPGEWFPAGRVAYASNGDWLWCELPCGRLLAYKDPRIELRETPWGEERLAVTCVWGAGTAAVGDPWPRRAMHGGVFIENITQATAASLLRDAILKCEDRGVPLILHVHDELLAEGDHSADLAEIMLDSPDWAAGLPLEVETGVGPRYGK